MERLRAQLDAFCRGQYIVVGSGKENSCQIKHLTPERDQIWELRSRSPKPSLRLLGGFSVLNEFVGISMHDRNALGAEGSREWRDAILSVKREWRRLFLTYPRMVGSDINCYISENVLDLRSFS